MKSSKEERVKVVDYKEVANSSKRVGRPNCLSNEKLHEMLKLYYSRPYSIRDLADMFGVSRMTIWRAVQTAQSLILG